MSYSLAAEHVDLAGMLDALITEVEARYVKSDFTRRRVLADIETYKLQSMGYAWGAEDHESSVPAVYGRDVCAYWEFGHMMAILCAEFGLQRRHSMPSIQDAWRAFKASVDIDQYVG